MLFQFSEPHSPALIFDKHSIVREVHADRHEIRAKLCHTRRSLNANRVEDISYDVHPISNLCG